MAIPVFFFTLFWCGFLVLWYSLASLGAPTMFLLVPLIHVGVGLYMAYYSLCLFLNKTYIELDDDWLTVSHQPIPWWRGNKKLPTSEIRQLYVREKISRNKNGKTYNYHLRAKLINGKDVPVVTVDNVDAPQIQEIEQRLEQFLSIPDVPVKGEFGKSNPTIPVHSIPPRRQRQRVNSPFAYFYNSKKGEFIDFKQQELELLGVTQLDWVDGNSDKLFQLVNSEDEETLIYFIQNNALLKVYEETAINLGEASQFQFSSSAPNAMITYKNLEFELHTQRQGKIFIPGIFPAVAVDQWMYKTKDETQYLRIIDKEGMLKFYRGQQLKMEDFGATLDLNQAPVQPEIRPLDEEDFV